MRPLMIAGRTTAAFVVVEPDGYRDDDTLREWINTALTYLATLPSRRSDGGLPWSR